MKNREWISQKHLLLLLGCLGLALPLVVIVWGWVLSGSIQNSMSDYYRLRTKEVFEGILFAIGCVLISYRGYDPLEYSASHLAGMFAVIVAFFPNHGELGAYHFISAVGLFLVLAFFPLFLWTRTGGPPKGFRDTITNFFRLDQALMNPGMTKQKRARNTIYVICGFVILAGIVLSGLCDIFWQNTPFFSLKPVLFFEWAMVWAISLAALVKGRALPFLKDSSDLKPVTTTIN
jgi:hypothetical protein